MTQETLHQTPRGGEVVREQIRAVGVSLRSAALVVAVVFGILTIKILIDIVLGSAASWFDSDDWSPIVVVSFFYPFAVWRRDKRFGPAFLWTLPVDRRRLALAKVFAGWVWLMIALAALVSWNLALAALAQVPGAETVPFIAFTGATAMYLLGSALVLGLRHPLRWLFGTAGLLFLLRGADEVIGRGRSRVETFLDSRDVLFALENAAAVWPFVGLAAGLIALWAAISRHRENR